ncbi:MAG: glycosyltransferase family 2 protein [Pseudomonas marincola]
MSNFSCCAIIPTLNHYKALPDVIAGVSRHSLEIIIIDDGSDADAASHIQALHNPSEGVEVIRHDVNLGKGAALETGLARSVERGFTHALQVDADGQHDLDDISKLMDAAKSFPADLITAKPVYDESMPTARKIGRWFTHVWVWVETLSFSITDSMCGFRVYPVSQTLDVIRREHVGKRMDFDTSVMVRLYWRGVDVVEIPSNVIYPAENTSNFQVVGDNIRITLMHTRLVFGMLARLLTFRMRYR